MFSIFQKLNPGPTDRFWEIQRGNFFFTTSIDESIAHASPLGGGGLIAHAYTMFSRSWQEFCGWDCDNGLKGQMNQKFNIFYFSSILVKCV